MNPLPMLRVLLGVLIAAWCSGKLHAADKSSVFDGPPAKCEPCLKPTAEQPAGEQMLRILTVEERVGEPRQNELVRVPVFFHTGECRDLSLLSIRELEPPSVATKQNVSGKRGPLVIQADDIRRDDTGNIARAHLYFLCDLQPWQRRQFQLIKRDKTDADKPSADVGGTQLETSPTQVRLSGDDLSLSLDIGPNFPGTIRDIKSKLGRAALAGHPFGPRIKLMRQGPDLKTMNTSLLDATAHSATEAHRIQYAAGPLFAKLRVELRPKDAHEAAEFTYIVPRHGHHFIVTQRLYPAEGSETDTVGAADNVLLSGKLILGQDAADMRELSVPAGLRRLTRSVHSHANRALINEKAGLGLLAVPYTQMGGGGVRLAENGEVQISGSPTFRRLGGSNSNTLRSYWGEVRVAITSDIELESLWRQQRRMFQPLVAVVDEPDVTPDDFRQELPTLVERFFEIQHWGRGWTQTAAMHWLKRDDAALQKLLAKQPGEKEANPAFYLPGWAARGEAMPPTKPGFKPDVGRLDPYGISYGASSVVPLALYAATPERRPALDAVALATGQASRQVNGRTHANGFPFINCFATAANMQIGSYHLGVYGGKTAGDADLVQFYRDCARTPAMQGIYGHGQRPYPGNVTQAEQSDLLYECTTDHHLRAMEVVCQENLELHPAVFGRYFDCVDVNADLIHRPTADGKHSSWHRANFFRGQAHDHRWESWDCAPYMGMFAKAGDGGRVGCTEGTYFLRYRSPQKINWSELLWFFHADVMLAHGLANYRPAELPPLPEKVTIDTVNGGGQVRWNAVPRASAYRVYRAEQMGGPWTWLNSPYVPNARAPLVETEFLDPAGKSHHVYFVTALDKEHGESAWFVEER